MEQPTLFEMPEARLRTIKGHDFGEVSSAMQKAIRRGDTRMAGNWGHELFASGFGPPPHFRASPRHPPARCPTSTAQR